MIQITLIRHFICTWMLIVTSYFQLLAQNDSTLYFKGIASLTNNGFSIIPAFSLGKPATSLDLMIGTRRFSFEPQFRFSLDGKPWIFNFTYRYKLANKNRYQLVLGSYLPALNFVTSTITNNGTQQDILTVRRFLSGELITNYIVSRNMTIGLYYLQGHGFQVSGPKNMYYLAFRGNVTKVRIMKGFYIDFNPQLYYLKVDTQDGFYANAALRIGLNDFPISISSIINKSIQSEVATKDFDWNLSILYTLEKRFISQD